MCDVISWISGWCYQTSTCSLNFLHGRDATNLIPRPPDTPSGELLYVFQVWPRRNRQTSVETTPMDGGVGRTTTTTSDQWTRGWEWEIRRNIYIYLPSIRHLSGKYILNLYASSTLKRNWDSMATSRVPSTDDGGVVCRPPNKERPVVYPGDQFWNHKIRGEHNDVLGFQALRCHTHTDQGRCRTWSTHPFKWTFTSRKSTLLTWQNILPHEFTHLFKLI